MQLLIAVFFTDQYLTHYSNLQKDWSIIYFYMQLYLFQKLVFHICQHEARFSFVIICHHLKNIYSRLFISWPVFVIDILQWVFPFFCFFLPQIKYFHKNWLKINMTKINERKFCDLCHKIFPLQKKWTIVSHLILT